MINWYFSIKSKIYKVLFTFIYFRLIHIKTNISILVIKNKKIYFIKTAFNESNSPVERSVKNSELFFNFFTKSKFVLTYDTVHSVDPKTPNIPAPLKSTALTDAGMSYSKMTTFHLHGSAQYH